MIHIFEGRWSDSTSAADEMRMVIQHDQNKFTMLGILKLEILLE